MMILPQKKDAIHKAWLCRILQAIADDHFLPSVLYFKGGTCASMLGWLDRFSVDLDFDYVGSDRDVSKVKKSLEELWSRLGLTIKDSSKTGIQYFLRYENEGRNTIKVDTSFPVPSSNVYAPQRFPEIDRILTCQTKETNFANKLIALIDRGKKGGALAGRDIYDVHYFFLHGHTYNPDVIRERSGTNLVQFFSQLLACIDAEATQKLLNEDLSYLLPYERFSLMRKVLKREVVTMIRDEMRRLTEYAQD